MDEQNTNTSDVLGVHVKVYPAKEAGSLLAFASVNLGGCFAVNGIRIMDTKKGTFIAMPSQKGKDGKYHDLCCPTTKEMRQALNAAILDEYQRAVEKPSVRGALQEATKEAAGHSAPPQERAADKGAR